MTTTTRPLVLFALTSGSGGGAERRVQTLAEAAPDRGWRAIVCYWRGRPPQQSSARYLRLPSQKLPTWVVPLATTVRRLRPDVIHLNGPTAGSLGALAVRGTSHTPIVYTDQSVHSSRSALLRGLRRVASRLPHISVAISHAVAESLVRDAHVPPSRVKLIRTGVPVVPPLDRAKGKGELVAVANLWLHKGHRHLLRALARLPRSATPGLKLIGDGPERGNLGAEARRLGIENRVNFLGWQHDAWGHANGALAFVHPSLREGLSLATMEAMMRGLPVIASKVGGIPELVSHERTGLLVPAGDEQALAAAIHRLIQDPSFAEDLGQAAREHALANFSLERFLDLQFELYDQLLGSKT